MNVIILGNGFDLAHGLETKYTDFIRFCTNFLEQNDKSQYDDIFRDKFYNLISSNLWYLIFSRILHFKGIISDYSNVINDTWIDFEILLYDILCQFDNEIIDFLNDPLYTARAKISLKSILHECINNFYKADKNWASGCLLGIVNVSGIYGKNYIKREKNHDFYEIMYKELRNFTQAFEIYCSYIIDNEINAVKNIELNSNFIQHIQKDHTEDIYVISFNYTPTFNKLYEKSFIKQNINTKFNYIYIHGKATDIINNRHNSTKLVLGTQNIEMKYNTDEVFDKFQKFDQRHDYSTMRVFQEFLRKLENKSINNNIYIVGHSLGITDIEMLQNIFDTNLDYIITIFYYTNYSRDKFKRIIKRIYDKKVVDSRFNFINLYDNEYGILRKIE
ncbi:MAG: bacteriophage abortive infection AbiH family protein [Deltaproteobacteria bacterium]|jgi:hypothetical protein|nr:bacteriophage abortive infection AbiH family protein [Deltaproteobacteria bacterium]